MSVHDDDRESPPVERPPEIHPDSAQGGPGIRGDLKQTGCVVDPALSSPRFCSYVQDNRLCTIALVPSAYGSVPVISTARVKGVPNGPVQIGVDENLDQVIEATMSKVMTKAELESIRKACGEMVERSRNGDQVAIANMAQMRKNAQNGSKRARYAYGCCMEYVKTHPVDGAVTMAGEPNMRAAVQLANGPSITKERLEQYLAAFGYHPSSKAKRKRHHAAMIHGIANFGAEIDEKIASQLDAVEKSLVELGRTIGMAFAIQRVRQPNSQVSHFSAAAGWELGE